jgi:hypothetical protein
MLKKIKSSAKSAVANDSIKPMVSNSLPWLFGSGIAAGHLMTASSCSLPQQGKCSVCGGCVVALGSLVSWAIVKNKQGNDFYSERQ